MALDEAMTTVLEDVIFERLYGRKSLSEKVPLSKYGLFSRVMSNLIKRISSESGVEESAVFKSFIGVQYPVTSVLRLTGMHTKLEWAEAHSSSNTKALVPTRQYPVTSVLRLTGMDGAGFFIVGYFKDPTNHHRVLKDFMVKHYGYGLYADLSKLESERDLLAFFDKHGTELFQK